MMEHKLRICLVDDDEDDYVLINALLGDVKAGGYELTWVSDFEAGREAILKQEYDVFLVDFRLGEGDGLELLRESAAHGVQRPIILLTGQGDYEIDLEAMRTGAADYLEKEWIDGHILERAIRYSIGAKRAQAELLTARDELERRIEERGSDLRAAYSELEQLAYVASHDLQEPLRAIEGVLKFLTEEYNTQLDDHTRRLIDRAVDGAGIIRLLNNRMLAYAGASRETGAPGLIKCSELLGALVAQLEDGTGLPKGAISWDEDLPTVVADAEQLGQVFRHLISNALNHRGEATPTVHVSAVAEEAHWVFSVSDNGVGIAPDQAEEIFYLFSPYHNRQATLGSGISLAVCKKIVEQHRGQIWVESTVGEGATFRFTLPRQPNQSPEHSR